MNIRSEAERREARIEFRLALASNDDAKLAAWARKYGEALIEAVDNRYD